MSTTCRKLRFCRKSCARVHGWNNKIRKSIRAHIQQTAYKWGATTGSRSSATLLCRIFTRSFLFLHFLHFSMFLLLLFLEQHMFTRTCRYIIGPHTGTSQGNSNSSSHAVNMDRIPKSTTSTWILFNSEHNNVY